MASRPRHTRAAQAPTAPPPSDRSTLLKGLFLTVIGLAGIVGGVLFSIEAPRFTPVPVVFLTFWLVMVIVGRILFTGLDKLRHSGANTPTSEQARAAAAVAGIVVAIGMMGFTATTAGSGTAAAAPCPGGGPATCGPTGPDLTFAPPTGQATAPGQQPGQQSGQDNNGIATSPARGGDNGPGIQAQTPEFGTPGQQAPNIPGNEQPGQGGGQQQGQQPQGNGQGQQNRNPAVQTTAPGGPQQTGQQQPGQQTQSGQPSTATVTVTTTQSECPMPGAPGANGGAPGAPGADGNDSGGTDSDSENKDGPPSWAYLVAEATGIMAGGRTRQRPTPGAVTSQLSSETLTDTTAATKASTQYYSSAQINPSPSGDMEPPAPNTADAPPSHQPMQPPSTGSGNSGSGPSSSPNPGASSGQGAPVGTSPGDGVGTGSNNGSTPTPMPGSAGNNITPTNFDGPDGEGYPQPGGVPGIFSFLWPLANALAKLFQDIFNRLIKPFLDWIAEIIRSINQFLIGLPGLIAILPDILRKYLEGIVGLIRGPERGMEPPTTGNPGTTAPTSPGDGEGGGNGDGDKPPKPTPPIVLPPGQNPGTDLPTPADPGTPLPGQPRPPITPKPTTPPDPGTIPAPGRIDPETGFPTQPPAKVIPRKPKIPGPPPQPGDLDPETGQPIPLPRPKPKPERGAPTPPTASNGSGQAPKPKKQPPAPTKPPPKPGNGGGPGRWERTNLGLSRVRSCRT